MAWATLDSIELDSPSSFRETNEVIGGYNTTLSGAKRRYIKAIKKRWQFSYDVMSANQYSLLETEYNKLIPSGLNLQTYQSYSTFTIIDQGFSISGEQVHMDLGDRSVLPGTDILSNIEITLTQL